MASRGPAGGHEALRLRCGAVERAARRSVPFRYHLIRRFQPRHPASPSVLALEILDHTSHDDFLFHWMD